MANKFLLIPADLYKGLLEDPNADMNLNFEKGEVQKMKNKPKKDSSAKNVMYNQKMKRYLKIKKQLDDKPIKVKLENGATLVAPPRSTLGYALRNPSLSVSSYNEDDDFEDATSYGMPESSYASLYDGAEEEDGTLVNVSTPMFQPSGTPTIIHSTPKNHPLTRKSNRLEEKNLHTTNLRIPAYKELYYHVMKNPSKFNVDPSGAILTKGRKEIKNSDFKESLERILDPSIKNMPTPPGTHYLRSMLKNDGYTNTLMSKGIKQAKDIRYKKPETSQLGTGFKLFRPKLWN